MSSTLAYDPFQGQIQSAGKLSSKSLNNVGPDYLKDSTYSILRTVKYDMDSKWPYQMSGTTVGVVAL